MNVAKFFLSSLLIASPVLAQPKFYTEAGIDYVQLYGANYASEFTQGISNGSTIAGFPVPGSTVRLLDDDKSAWAPSVAAGYTFSERVGLRLSYHYLGQLSAGERISVLVGGDASLGDVLVRFNDTVHLITLAPQFEWPITGRISIELAPELNWVASRGEVLTTASNPSITVLPRRTRNEEGFSFGASIRAKWVFTEKWDLTLGYKYADLQPSWGRQAHLITAGLRLHF